MSQSEPLDAIALAATIPLFAGLPPAEIEALLRVCEPVTYADGDTVVRQGQPADGAYILETGGTEVSTALPGGGETIVARLGPGSVLGEMALLDHGTRSATVIARGSVTGRFIGRDAFRLLLAQRAHAAFTIRTRITRTLCQRLRELNTQIIAADMRAQPQAPQSEAQAQGTGLRFGASTFEWRQFLALLPAFEGYGPASIADFAARTKCVEVTRGTMLFEQGDPGSAAFVVVRGALQIDHTIDGQRRRIGILGPGRLCGILALIEARAHSMSARARERTTLLGIAKGEFDALFAGNDLVATKFQDAIHRELLSSLARTNNHLTRLISQARIRGYSEQATAAATLTCKLALIDCSAASAQSR